MLPPPLPELGQRLAPPAPWLERLFPVWTTLRGYRVADLRGDLVAGLTTALFTVPQGMAYALIAGFSPSAGIASSVAASILGAAFGSSEFLINGPTNAISVMIAGDAALFAAGGNPLGAVILLTLVIGVAQLLAGLLRIGTLTRFVSDAVLMGFTAGAGVYIVVNQLPSFLGVEKGALASDLWGWVPTHCAAFDLLRLLRSLHGVNIPTLALATLTFVTIRVIQRLEHRVGRKLPASFLAVVMVTFLAWALGAGVAGSAWRVKLVSDIEPIRRALPAIQLPHIDLASVRALLEPAFAIGLMGAVEAIAIGKSLAMKAGHRFDASRQLIGEGLCNIGAALVGGFPSSGSFTRTAVNYEAGAHTRLSAIFSGVLVMAIVLLFAPAANLIPIAALAGTLVHVGFKLVDLGRMRVLIASTQGDRRVLLVTFAAVLLSEHLETALFVGMAVSIYYALRRAEGFKLRVLEEGLDGVLTEHPNPRPGEVGDIAVLNLSGEVFFAAADELQLELMKMLDTTTRFVVLRVQEAYNLDATCAEAIASVAIKARARGGRLLLSGVRPGMYNTLSRANLLDRIGQDCVFPAERELLGSTHHALAAAKVLAAAVRPTPRPPR